MLKWKVPATVFSVVVLGSFFLLLKPATDRRPDHSGEALLSASEHAALRSITLQSPQGKLVLERTSQGAWGLAHRNHFPVSQLKLDRLLEMLGAQRLTQSLFVDDSDLNALGFASAVDLTLAGSAGFSRKISFGKDRKPNGKYIRLNDSAVPFLIERQMPLEVDEKEWLDRVLWSLPEEQVAEVRLTYPSDRSRPAVVLSRRTPGAALEVQGLPQGVTGYAPDVHHLLSVSREFTITGLHPTHSPMAKFPATAATVLEVKSLEGKSHKIEITGHSEKKAASTQYRSFARLPASESGAPGHLREWHFEIFDDAYLFFDKLPLELARPELAKKRHKR